MKKAIIEINTESALPSVSAGTLADYEQRAQACNRLLETGQGVGNQYLGWVDLPEQITSEQFREIEETAADLRRMSDVIIVIGIGGSYLGARAVIEAMSSNFEMLRRSNQPKVVFAGQNLSEDYLYELLAVTESMRISAIVISKSGMTMEPAIAFRLLKHEIELRYGVEEARQRIVAVTDARQGALHALAVKEGYRRFVIPDDVGGRYSVFTPVGLLPVAAAGMDIKQLIEGARAMRLRCIAEADPDQNPALKYAAIRYALYQSGKKIEILSCYYPKFLFVSEWWKQLFGESEGKNHRGLYPSSVTFTTDLHSLGQYIQDGERHLFETVIKIKEPRYTLKINATEDDIDNLNYIAGRRIHQVNDSAQQATVMAHVEGGVPNILISIPSLNEYYLGGLLYFFERACGISSYLLGVNPFNQEGVENYKKKMYTLLGRD